MGSTNAFVRYDAHLPSSSQETPHSGVGRPCRSPTHNPHITNRQLAMLVSISPYSLPRLARMRRTSPIIRGSLQLSPSSHSHRQYLPARRRLPLSTLPFDQIYSPRIHTTHPSTPPLRTAKNPPKPDCRTLPRVVSCIAATTAIPSPRRSTTDAPPPKMPSLSTHR